MSDSIAKLAAIIESRKQNSPPGSYTSQLFAAGENEILKKIGEEAIEVVIAAKGESDDRIVYELADLMYHSLVLLAVRDISWSAVEAELASRM